MSTAQLIARRLLEVEAVKLSPREPFTWASGRKAPIYCDNRLLLSYPAIRREVIRAFEEQAREWKPFDAIAGVATAGIPHGALLADRLDLPFLYVRSTPKSHGRRNQIEGRLLPGQRLVVIEDLISTGGSCLRAVEALRGAGASVAGAMAIFSYGFEEAARAFDQNQLPWKTLTQYDTLLEEALQEHYIAAADLATLQHWRRQPAQWQPG